MKRWFYVFFLGLLLAACVRETIREAQEELLATSKLGKVFVRNLVTMPEWKAEWDEVVKLGIPLVDNVIVDYHDKYGFYYLVPILSDEKIVEQFALYPMKITTTKMEAVIRLEAPVLITKKRCEMESELKTMITPMVYFIISEAGYLLDPYFIPEGCDKLSRSYGDGEARVYCISFIRNDQPVSPWREDPSYLGRFWDMFNQICGKWGYPCHVLLSDNTIKIYFFNLPTYFDSRTLDDQVQEFVNSIGFYLPEVLVIPDRHSYIVNTDNTYRNSLPDGLFMLQGRESISVSAYLSSLNPPKPPAHINHVDPCQYMADRRRNPLFKRKMDELKMGTTLPYEVVVYFTLSSGSGIEFTKEVGGENAGGVDFVVHDPIDGIIHTHNSDGLPVFSIDDLIVPYNLRQAGMMIEPKRFTMGLVTPKTTLFLFYDENVYYSWMQKNIGNMRMYSDLYENAYKITKDTPSDLAVENFARFLNQLNMGITLMEKDSESDTYKQVKYSGGKVIKIGCD